MSLTDILIKSIDSNLP